MDNWQKRAYERRLRHLQGKETIVVEHSTEPVDPSSALIGATFGPGDSALDSIAATSRPSLGQLFLVPRQDKPVATLARNRAQASRARCAQLREKQLSKELKVLDADLERVCQLRQDLVVTDTKWLWNWVRLGDHLPVSQQVQQCVQELGVDFVNAFMQYETCADDRHHFVWKQVKIPRLSITKTTAIPCVLSESMVISSRLQARERFHELMARPQDRSWFELPLASEQIEGDDYELSTAMQRLSALERYVREGDTLNLNFVSPISGLFDPDEAKKAWLFLQSNHRVKLVTSQTTTSLHHFLRQEDKTQWFRFAICAILEQCGWCPLRCTFAGKAPKERVSGASRDLLFAFVHTALESAAGCEDLRRLVQVMWKWPSVSF